MAELERRGEGGEGGGGEGGGGEGGGGEGGGGEGGGGEGGGGDQDGTTGTKWKHRPLDSWPSFMDWARVNSQSVELMAGHHRVEALKAHLKERQADTPEERWWLCDVYDQGE